MPLKIAVDVDGVLADQVSLILQNLNKKYNKNYIKNDIKHWNERIEDTTIDVEIEKSLLDYVYVMSMPVIQGAKEAMAFLHKNYHITIATNRPKDTEEATKKWVSKYFKFHDFCNTKGKGKDCVISNLLIDDHIPNIETFASKRGIGLLFSQPWNQDRTTIEYLIKDNKVYICQNWLEVIAIIKEIDVNSVS